MATSSNFRLLNFVLVLYIVFGSKSELLAQEIESIQTDRPDLTESAFTVPAGYFQLEAGILRTVINKTTQLNLHPTLLFKYGVSSSFEFRLITTWRLIRTMAQINFYFYPLPSV